MATSRRRATDQASTPLSRWLVDTHCHLDRYPDPRAEADEAQQAGVVVVSVTELPSQFQRQQLRFRDHPTVRVAIGIHPMAAGRVTPMEMGLFRRLLSRTDYVGEIGLDGSPHGRPSLRLQRQVFDSVLSHHQITSKILTVHSRGAEKEVVSALSDVGAPAILHWYSGPLGVLDQALDAGMYFSINPSMIRTKSGQRIIAAVPHARALTESDGPYTKRGGRSTRPSDMPWLVEHLAALWSLDPDEARRQLHENMVRLHGKRGLAAPTDGP